MPYNWQRKLGKNKHNSNFVLHGYFELLVRSHYQAENSAFWMGFGSDEVLLSALACCQLHWRVANCTVQQLAVRVTFSKLCTFMLGHYTTKQLKHRVSDERAHQFWPPSNFRRSPLTSNLGFSVKCATLFWLLLRGQMREDEAIWWRMARQPGWMAREPGWMAARRPSWTRRKSEDDKNIHIALRK